MALQLGVLRDALIEAGASEASAGKAAEEVAGYENRLANIEEDVRLIKWSQALLISGVAALILKSFL